MTTSHTGISDRHHAHAHADPPVDAMAEVLELDAEVMRDYLAELTAWLAEFFDREPGHIIDIGSGTGAGSIALAQRFTHARVTALDVSPEMLHRLSANASAAGLGDRIRGVQADLDREWPALEPCDLAWAGSSLHHMADPARVLASARGSLRPDGLIAITEMDFLPRFLPDDIGVGRPGMESRLRAALNTARDTDWTDTLGQAGFLLQQKRVFDINLNKPLPPGAARYTRACLTVLRSHAEGELAADDLAALDALLDDDGAHSVLARDDLTVRTKRTTWVGRPG